MKTFTITGVFHSLFIPHNAKIVACRKLLAFMKNLKDTLHKWVMFLEARLSGSFLLLAFSHPFLEKLHNLLDTVVDITGVRFQHQLRSLWFFILRIDPSEAFKGQQTAEGAGT